MLAEGVQPEGDVEVRVYINERSKSDQIATLGNDMEGDVSNLRSKLIPLELI
jgi:hypothetical protein